MNQQNAAKTTKVKQEKLGKVLVLGLGKSGKAVARYAVQLLGTRVTEVFIAAGAQTPQSQEFVDSLQQPGVRAAFGDDALQPLIDAGEHFDVCIASPGIPYWHQLYVSGQQLSNELMSEVEFSWRESRADSVWVAITGTNGKTTTTSCCASVLRACGFEAQAVGNIGDVCLTAVLEDKTKVYVAEVSSYQLYSTSQFAPDVAVLMNITPDHVHWHKSFEAYRDAKFNVLRNPRVAIMDATNEVVRSQVRAFKEAGKTYIPVGTASGMHDDMRARCGAQNAAFLGANDMLTVAFDGTEHALLPAAELQIPGEHNASNALVAAAVAVVLGGDDATIARALTQFHPLEHRIEPCGVLQGATCYNDSKATNVDATLKALGAFPGKRMAVLLGGDDKGTSLQPLVQAVHESCVAAVCFGAAGPRFASAFTQAQSQVPANFTLLQAHRMEEALDAALEYGRTQGLDVVLLSPACASFDEFTSFENRGTVFKQLVAQRVQDQAQGSAE